MRLTRIATQNWMAYEDLDLDLAPLSQVAITGLNNHGKSAVLDAVLWCLYGRVGRDVDQRSMDGFVRRGEQEMLVRVEFDTPSGHRVAVTREKSVGKSGTLSLVIDGEERKRHTIAETQDAIESLIGLDADALLVGPFMVQEQSSAFMRAQPRERKDVLMRLLGLDEYERLWRAAKDRQSEAQRQREGFETRITEAERVAEGRHEAEVLLEAAKQEWAKGAEAKALAHEQRVALERERADLRVEVERLQGDLRVAEQIRVERERLDADEERAQRVLALEYEPEVVLAGPTAQEVADARDSARAGRQAREEYEKAQSDFRLASDRLSRYTEAASVVNDVPCGGKGGYAACPLLAQGWAAVAQVEAESPRLSTARALAIAWREAAEAAEGAEATYERLSKDYAFAELARSRAAGARQLWEQRCESATQDLTRIDERRAELPEPVDASVISDSLDRLRDQQAAKANELHAAEALQAEGSKIMAGAEPLIRASERTLGAIEAAEASLRTFRDQRDEWTAQAEVWGVLAAAWHRDGIPTTIIERALPQIEEGANAILARLPEALSVALRTQRPVNKGKGMAETLDVVVSIDGWESDYALLSVGARFRVDLALRVALGQVLVRRGGGGLDTLWLDEPLAALDAPGREAAVTALNALSDDFGLVVVVSHHPDFNDAFPARIEIVKEGGISRAEVLA